MILLSLPSLKHRGYMLAKFTHLKSSMHTEFIRHFSLLSVKKENILTYFSSSYRILLIVLFTLLFLPHVFVVVSEDINFIMAYEVDPGSIIQSILSLFRHDYNMNAAFHSSLYGWTYYSLTFLLLIPVYVITELNIVPNNYYLFVSIRFIFFAIGLASVLAFFEVAKRTLKQNFLSFLAATLYIASPVVFKLFYFLHPETTGLLFFFISILCLIHYNEREAKDYRWYTFGLLSLVLSALSKHVFLFIVPPVIFLYIYFYSNHHKISVLHFLVSKQFSKVLFASIVFSVFIFFVINPFAFFQPKIFITNQVYLFSTHTHSTLPYIEAVKAWIKIIKTIPIIFISIISLPFTISGVAFFKDNKKTGKVLYIVNILSAVLFVIIISISSQYMIMATYFAPVYPFFILNFISIPLYIVRKWNVSLVKLSVVLFLSYSLFFILVGDFSTSIPTGYTRLKYQDSLQYKVYNYIEENIPYGSKIAHDQYVPVPSNKGLKGCHYWQGCGTDYIEEFQPDYVIFDENWVFGGETYSGTMRLKKYVSDHKFIFIESITSSNGDGPSVSVWKRPDQ